MGRVEEASCKIETTTFGKFLNDKLQAKLTSFDYNFQLKLLNLRFKKKITAIFDW